MKVFLVFLALAVVFSGLLIFSSDMREYMILQSRLKILAEDCAHAAALCIDEAASAASGSVQIDIERGQAAAERLLESSDLLDAFGSAEVSIRIRFESPGCVRAELNWRGRDMFRLAYIEKKEAARSAAYEWR